MKTFFASFLLCVVLLSLNGQSPVEPEFANVFFALGAGKLLPLEREPVTVKATATLLLAVKAALEIPGPKASVRLPAGSEDFIVKALSIGADPEAVYRLRRFESTKKTRRVTVGHVSALGASFSDGGMVPMAFSRYGEFSLKMTATLPPRRIRSRTSGSEDCFLLRSGLGEGVQVSE